MKKENLPWIEPQQITVPGEISEFFPEYPVISRVLAQRGITTAETLQPFLYPEAYQPLSPFKFPGVSKAVELVQEAISLNQMIGVWGDFDVDGQTATAILVGSLRQLGARVTYHIPVRGKESHGITIPYLKEFLAQGINLLLTCDTGITAHEAVQFAKQQGVKVIITDHHSLESTLPDADCIVHPHLLENGHPARTLCGAGAALELAAGLLDDPQFKNYAGLYLDLAAIGTIADLAALKGDNRFFVQLGLQRIRKDPKPLLQAVFEIAELDHSQVTENQISFQVAPRLNALGRLSDANRAVEMLLSTNLDECREFINQVETMNIKRKLITEQVFQATCAQVEADPEIREKPVIIASHPEWPGGVIGIVASRLVEIYQKPALVVSSPVGEVVRGSARSVEGLDITASLKKTADLLITCGGHPMAAGFSILPENFEEFKAAITRIIAQTVAAAPLEQALTIDAFIMFPEISLELAEALEKLAPFGPGNPPVTFASRG
ncbi:MAG TPA: single-stranded-DNA-specific exonuclease RecJ, partial [Anaerolineaceae bacterium]|nr:single-stranded-DNA-specific exonuclease RecJ [Anaerolineaceae bacterium]